MGELQISWVGSDEGEVLVTDEFDIPPQPLDLADEPAGGASVTRAEDGPDDAGE